MVRVDESHLAILTDCTAELLNDLGSGVECTLECAGVFPASTLHPPTHLGGVGDVTDEQQHIGLDESCCVNKLLHELRIVEWDLKVRNNHRSSHANSVSQGRDHGVRLHHQDHRRQHHPE